MSTISNAILTPNSVNDTILQSIGKFLMRGWIAYMDWRLRRLAIHRLRGMSDRELKDMGVSRSQIEFAVRREPSVDPMFNRSF